MAYRYGEDRTQMSLFPASISDYVSKDDPVRAYDAFVKSLDLESLGFEYNPHKVGNSSYSPRMMVKLIVYAYSYGVRSSRMIERALYHNLSFIWLMKGLKPDHKTIAEFRRKNKSAIKMILKGCARMCIELGLIEGNVLFVDGTKIRANANIKNSWDKKKCEEYIKGLGKKIDTLLRECDQIDEQEDGQGSLVKMKEELSSAEVLQEKVKGIARELTKSEKPSVNTTDKECGRMNSLEGKQAGYNVQSSVDERHGLIVNVDVTEVNNDKNQLSTQVKAAQDTLKGSCATVVADAGYSTTEELMAVSERDVTPIVPPHTKKVKPEGFVYDSRNDHFICPEGRRLTNRGKCNNGKLYKYKIEGSTTCNKCKRHGTCHKRKTSKSITVLVNEKERQRFENIYRKKRSQQIYGLRKQKVELPFGHIKHNLGFRQFLLRGKQGANAEISIAATCFNVARMITIAGGVNAFVQKMAAIA